MRSFWVLANNLISTKITHEDKPPAKAFWRMDSRRRVARLGVARLEVLPFSVGAIQCMSLLLIEAEGREEGVGREAEKLKS
jgi:hypothetical protein